MTDTAPSKILTRIGWWKEINWPIVASTWLWRGVIDEAWTSIQNGNDWLLAVEYECRGYEDNPTRCETTLGAMIMYEAAAVAQLRNINHEIYHIVIIIN